VTWLAPGYLGLAVLAAAAVVALHFFTRRVPKPRLLPTARFVPEAAVSAPSPASRPADLVVLALRALALLCAGAALARPVPAPPRAVLRVVVAHGPDALPGARALLGPGDTLVVSETGTLSAALVRARRAAARVAGRADSIELVLVAPFVRGEWDAATAALRATWPGRAQLVAVAQRPPAAPPRLEFGGGPADDPLAAAARLLGERRGAATRIARGAARAADSAFARGGGALVVWPTGAETAPRGAADTIGAVIAAGTVVVAPFARTVRLDEPPAPAPAGNADRVVARWADGAPAALERSLGSGCVRSVAIPVPTAGDLVLRRSFREVLDALAAPCGGSRDPALLDSVSLETLRGPEALAAAAALGTPAAPRALIAWLLALAALLLFAELGVRAWSAAR